MKNETTDGVEDGLDAVKTSMKEYLKSVTEMNKNLENLVEARTKEIPLANEKLRAALAEVRQLSGLLPICTNCKGIRDDKGYWNQIEDYISTHTEAILSHSICPKCAKELYPDLDL